MKSILSAITAITALITGVAALLFSVLKLRSDSEGRIGDAKSGDDYGLGRGGDDSAAAVEPEDAPADRFRKPGEPIVVEVLFGTNRSLISHSPPKFSNIYDDVVRFGRAEVTIPPNGHKIGRLETPQLFQDYDPLKHITFQYAHLLQEAQFLEAIDAGLQAKRAAFVFVHGFATTFENAARRTAQLHYDLRFPGPPLFFSWASVGHVGVRPYTKDAETCIASAEHLRAFLDLVARRTNVEVLHIIAHSMGNRTLLEALRDWRPPRDKTLRHIVLVAPDVNKRYFRQKADVFVNHGNHVTLYGSRRDFALQVSRAWAGNEERAGDANPPVTVIGVDTIDLSDKKIKHDRIRHFLLDDARVLGDMNALIGGDLPVNERVGLEPRRVEDGQYWLMLEQ